MTEFGPTADPGGTPSEELIDIAMAMAQREVESKELFDRIRASLSGTEYVPPAEELQRKSIIGEAALSLLRIENPDAIITIDNITETRENSGAYQSFVNNMNNQMEGSGFYISKTQAKNLDIAAFLEIKALSGISDEKRAQNFTRRYAAAREVAGENNVPTAEVYRRDDLYYAAVRRTQTMESFVRKVLPLLSTVSVDTIQATVIRNADRLLPPQLLEVMDDQDLQEALLESQLDSEFSRHLQRQTDISQEALRQATMYRFLKIYGRKALLELPEDLRDGFAPRMPWVSEVFREFMGNE